MCFLLGSKNNSIYSWVATQKPKCWYFPFRRAWCLPNLHVICSQLQLHSSTHKTASRSCSILDPTAQHPTKHKRANLVDPKWITLAVVPPTASTLPRLRKMFSTFKITLVVTCRRLYWSGVWTFSATNGLLGESRTGIDLAGRLRGGVTGGPGRVGGGERSYHVTGANEAGTVRDCDNLHAEVGGPRHKDGGGLPLDTEHRSCTRRRLTWDIPIYQGEFCAHFRSSFLILTYSHTLYTRFDQHQMPESVLTWNQLLSSCSVLRLLKCRLAVSGG